MMTNEERQLGRAKNAVLTFLENKLIVPKIYLDADWDGRHVDVLAIERDGAGDVHAVLLFANHSSGEAENVVDYLTKAIPPLIDRLLQIPAQYKYIASVDVVPNGGDALPGLPHAIVEQSFSPDGVGKMGFLAIEFLPGQEPEARIVFRAERFRAKIAKLADEYVQQHEADWEIRA
jgi:hypothetical protein